MNSESVIIVSGLPRSGTSMMMKMLKLVGIPVLEDGIRKLDENNPQGYYEYELVKKLKQNNKWLNDAKGFAVKIVATLLQYLPERIHYKIIFMERDINEIISSQRKMLTRMKNEENVENVQDDSIMKKIYTQHLEDVKLYVNNNKNMDVLYISYNEILINPYKEGEKISKFFGGYLNVSEMIAAVDINLYRERKNIDGI